MEKIRLIFFAVSLLMQSCMLAESAFQTDILPLLKESCVSCHGPKKQMGQFRADLRGEYLKDTGNGPWIVPGDSQASRLVALLSGDIKTKKSPEKHVFPPEKIALIRAWIDSGAK